MTRIVKTLSISVAAVLITIGLFSVEARAEKRIGILIWSEEVRYTDANNGFMEQLKKDGFGEAKVKFTIENAKGNKVKAAEFAQKFASAKMDMVVALGTTAAIAVAKEIKDVPVILNFIWDPVDSKIAVSWQNSGNNTTGSSAKFPMSKLVSRLKQLAPVKNLAVLYTTGEKNSESQLKEIQETQAEFQIKVVPVPLTNKAEVAQIIPEVCGTVDAMYLSGSNVVAETLETIVNAANKAKVITVTHLDSLVEKGALLGVYADPFSVGRLAGEKAAKIFKGAKPSSIPYEMLKKVDVIVNMKTAKAGGFQIPPAFLKSASKIIE